MPFHLFGYAADTSARIYARGGSFSELGINGNLGWGTLGDALRNTTHTSFEWKYKLLGLEH